MRENLKLISAFESVALKLPGKLAAELNRKEIDNEAMIFFLEIVKRYGTKKEKIIWGLQAVEKKKKVNQEEKIEKEIGEKIDEEENENSNLFNEVNEEEKIETVEEKENGEEEKTVKRKIRLKRRRFR